MARYLFIRDQGGALQRVSLTDVPSLFCVREPKMPPRPRGFALVRARVAATGGAALTCLRDAAARLPRRQPAVALATK